MSKNKFPLFLIVLAVLAWAVVQFGERWLRFIFIYLSQAGRTARQLISSIPVTQQVASRFVAGETMDDAIEAARAMNMKGMRVTMDLLGEHVSNADEAIAARGEIARLLQRIASSELHDTNVSVKLSQLGMRISEQLVVENMRVLLAQAQELNNRIRIDMEESEVTDQTLRIYRTLRQEFPTWVLSYKHICDAAKKMSASSLTKGPGGGFAKGLMLNRQRWLFLINMTPTQILSS